MTRYIFVAGGVMSGVGKGTSTAAIGAILLSKGFRVTALKIDPYVNVDAGTMNPVEHGEVFVTNDGDETDQDIGNYERFLNQDITRVNYMTTGRVYLSVIERERALGYHGKCVEVVPCVPQEVIARIEHAGKKHRADFVLIEIGGTVGEYENILFLEALRMMKLKNPERVCTALVSYLPVPPSIGEMKTKPTQHAVRELNRAGLAPDLLICRSEQALDAPRRTKLGRFCGVPEERIFTAPNASSVYEVPLLFDEQQMGNLLLHFFGLRKRVSHLEPWKKLVHTIRRVDKPVRIAVVGKYFATGGFVLSDAYVSVIEALKHAAWSKGRKPVLEWIDAERFEKDPKAVKELAGFDGVLVPGGFGTRGIEGILTAIRFVREKRIPYFGICYGLQLACVEGARHLCGLKQAHTTEVFAQTPDPVVHVNPLQARNLLEKKYGATMRLGSYSCRLSEGSRARKAYGRARIQERHRHRYEVNPLYIERLAQKGLVVSGVNPETKLVEIVERPDHPFFVGVQFHPEFTSRPHAPHPLFVAFLEAAIRRGSPPRKSA